MKKELSVMTKKFLWSILIVLIISSYAIQIVSNVFASVAGSFDGTNAYDINNNRVNLNGPSNPQKVADLSAVNSEGNPNPAGNPVNVDGTAYNQSTDHLTFYCTLLLPFRTRFCTINSKPMLPNPSWQFPVHIDSRGVQVVVVNVRT